MCLASQEELEKLNRIVWPAVIEEAQRRIRALGEAGYKVVVMEAAVMVRAKWYKYCHQLWSVIIPPAEVKIDYLVTLYYSFHTNRFETPSSVALSHLSAFFY